MLLSIAFFVAWVVAPANAGPEPPSPEQVVSFPKVVEGRAPPPEGRAPGSPLPPDGVAPLQSVSPALPRAPTPSLPADGATPLDPGPDASLDASAEAPPEAALPLGLGPESAAPEPIDPTTTRLVRLDFLLGPVWRIRQLDTMTTLEIEVGRMQGFSATFHTSMILASQRDFVRVLDVPVGFGAVARGKLRDKPLYGSVGLSAGILVHRAATDDQGVIHRVDPDLRLPLRAAWTIASVGTSLAIVPGYSIRERTYERRGVPVWRRDAFRIGLLIGLHWDIVAGRAKRRLIGRRNGEH